MRCRNLVRISMWLRAGSSWAVVAAAAVKTAGGDRENRCFQRGQSGAHLGWPIKGEEVTVTIAGQTLTTKAGDDGRWKVVLAKLDVGQPVEMTVKSSSGNTIALKNILVGEVWAGSGQSNMEMAVVSSNNAQKEIATANHPTIRLFTVAKRKSPQPESDCPAVGRVQSDHGARFLGRVVLLRPRPAEGMQVPVGLIHTSWGGTPAEFWISRKALEADPSLKPLAKGEAPACTTA